MFRVTIEAFPDNCRWTPKLGRVVRIIDIKNDGSGSYLEADYKTRFYKSRNAEADWRPKQVRGVKFKELIPEKLVRDAIDKWLKDYENRELHKAGSAEYTRSQELST